MSESASPRRSRDGRGWPALLATVSALVDGVPDTASVAVPVPDAALRVAQDPWHDVPAGTSIKFTAYSPNAPDSLIKDEKWNWVKHPLVPVPQTQACADKENPCTTVVHESGEMHVDALVSGEKAHAFAKVWVGTVCTRQRPDDCPGLAEAIDSLKNHQGQGPMHELCREAGAMAESILDTGQILSISARGASIAITTRAGGRVIVLEGLLFLHGASGLKSTLAHEAAHHMGYSDAEIDPLAPIHADSIGKYCR